jgi:hypothetical protein
VLAEHLGQRLRQEKSCLTGRKARQTAVGGRAGLATAVFTFVSSELLFSALRAGVLFLASLQKKVRPRLKRGKHKLRKTTKALN